MFWPNFSKIDQSRGGGGGGGGGAALFSSRRPKNFEKEKIFLCLRIAEMDRESQFWVEKNDSRYKTLF